MNEQKPSQIVLSPTATIPLIEWTVSANAILGIRESGKTSTGKVVAEQLMDNGIPIIAIGLAGNWEFLKVGKAGKGYPVVVVGKGGDLPLNQNTIDDIIRSAIKENISLVIDCFSMGADGWKMVQNLPDILLYENKTGFKHLFIEEAHQIVPETMHKSRAVMFRKYENLLLVGGNSQVGITLISQRTEQMNKSLLENCPNLILHKQVGRNSLSSFKKAIEFTNPDFQKEIIKSLPELEKGECWVMISGEPPQKVKVNETKTFHPDRRKPHKINANMQQDVTSFVSRLQKTMKEEKEKPVGIKEVSVTPSADFSPVGTMKDSENYNPVIETLKKELALKEERIKNMEAELKTVSSERYHLQNIVTAVRERFLPDYTKLKAIMEATNTAPQQGNSFTEHPLIQEWKAKLKDYEGAILLELARSEKGWKRNQLVPLTKYSYSTVKQGVQALKRYNLILEDGDILTLNKELFH